MGRGAAVNGSTVIVAADYGTAATTAARLGLGLNWHYPHDIEHVRGLAIGRVIYVEGWETSQALTAEAVTAVVARMTSYATEEHISSRPPFDIAVSSPFLETVTSEAPRNIQHGQRRPSHRVTMRWLWAVVPVGFILGVAGAAIADALGWFQ